MQIRTPYQVKVIYDQSLVNLHQQFELGGVYNQAGLVQQASDVEQSWVRQLNIQSVIASSLATEAQKAKAADELARLALNVTGQDGTFVINMWEEVFA